MPRQAAFKESASQTAGPYAHIGGMPNFAGIPGVFPGDLGADMIGEGAKGERISITGHIYDGAGDPVRDGILEIWQADASGLFNAPAEHRGTPDPAFSGWGRRATDLETGIYRFDTIKPGQVPAPNGQLQAPHIALWIVARGINIGLLTRMYFGDEVEANAVDPVLTDLADQDRVPTLVAEGKNGAYTFDIHLQGPRETVFFDI